jgi:thioredoxin-related protein
MAMARAIDATGRRTALMRLALALPSIVAPAVLLAQGRAHAELPRIEDLRRDKAQMRRSGVPMLLFFSMDGCPFCIEVRRNYLVPRLGEQPGSLLIREIEIGSRRTFAGEDGAPVSEAEFASRFGVRRVPVVQMVDADLGPIGRPLVGLDSAGFYEAYLAAAIEAAQKAMKKG